MAAVETQGKCSVLVLAAMETQGKGSGLVTKAVKTQGKGSVLVTKVQKLCTCCGFCTQFLFADGLFQHSKQ